MCTIVAIEPSRAWIADQASTIRHFSQTQLAVTEQTSQHTAKFKHPPTEDLQMTFSPPARSKLSVDIRGMQRRDTFDITSGGRQIRATTWKQQQTLQLVAVPRVPRESGLKTAPLLSQSLHSLSSSSSQEGMIGVSHTHAPTDSRPGYVALITDVFNRKPLKP